MPLAIGALRMLDERQQGMAAAMFHDDPEEFEVTSNQCPYPSDSWQAFEWRMGYEKGLQLNA